MYDEESVNEIIEELEIFHKNTGLKPNYDKSVIYKVGARARCNHRLHLKRKFKWGRNLIESLGIIINVEDLNSTEHNNYGQLIEKVDGILTVWRNQNLTLLGKIEVVNTLVCSIFVYKMQVLPTMSTNFKIALQRLIANFIWNGRKPKIKYSTLTLNRIDGGRRLTNLKLRDHSLKIEWVKRLGTADPEQSGPKCECQGIITSTYVYYSIFICISSDQSEIIY